MAKFFPALSLYKNTQICAPTKTQFMSHFSAMPFSLLSLPIPTPTFLNCLHILASNIEYIPAH